MSIQLIPGDPHDERLISQVAPRDWVNPKPRERYDLVVVGGGSAGLVSAAGAAGLGAKVALVEKQLLGGDCLNAGCVPSKALLRCAKAAAEVRNGLAYGVKVPFFQVDFPAVMERLRGLRADLARKDSAERFRDLGVDLFRGEGKFISEDALAVEGQVLRFRKAFLATGTRPAIPPIPGLGGVKFLTNESVFALREMPESLVVIGGGPVGCELAQAFARFGSKVTLCITERLLPKEDADAAAILEAAFVTEGIRIVREPVDRVEPGVLHLKAEAIPFAQLLISTGRKPVFDGLGLDNAKVRLAEGLLAVNDFLRTSNRRIYAVGDVASKMRFTHAADATARLALRNAFFWGRGRLSSLRIPSCVYTDPEVASVGLSQATLDRFGMPYRVVEQPFAETDRAVLDGKPAGFVRFRMDRQSDRIAGATVVGPNAGELIGTIAFLMQKNYGLRDLAAAIFPYPTSGEILRQLGDQSNRARLTPFNRWLLRKIGGFRA
jgi:pyruvate/2-oxoglutarate dehydrogenase complex dihydrolipoamide dehydrogenase (E3) component